MISFDEVDSTNTRIKAAIARGEAEGTCFVARRQTAAYGRQGRAWSSPAGGLYFSFILDPLGMHAQSATAAKLPSLSLVIPLAVQESLSSATRSDTIKIKWPNDILVVQGQRIAKLCGISLELVQGKLCCGIGINVFRSSNGHTQTSASQTLRYDQGYLEDLDSSFGQDPEAMIAMLLPDLLQRIEAYYLRWLDEGIEPFIGQYDQLLYNRGQQVALETIDGKLMHEGEVLGVAQTGELLLRDAQGAIIHANSGEVHTRL